MGREAIELLFEQMVELAMNDSLCRGCFMVNATTELAANDDEVADKACNNRCHSPLKEGTYSKYQQTETLQSTNQLV